MSAVLLSCGWMAVGGTNDCIRTARELSRACADQTMLGTRFELTAKIVFRLSPPSIHLFVRDETGIVLLHDKRGNRDKDISEGDLMRLSGFLELESPNPPPGRHLNPNCRSLVRLSRGNPDQPIPLDVGQIADTSNDLAMVSFSGVVRDIIRDDIDPNIAFLSVCANGQSADVCYSHTDDFFAQMTALLGQRISITGIKVCAEENRSNSRQLKLFVFTRPDLVRTVGPAPRDDFDFPDITSLKSVRPSHVSSLGCHTAAGTVRAVWKTTAVLIETPSGEFLGVSLRDMPAPEPGTFVEVVGLPETDLYHLTLTHALWRPGRGKPMPAATAEQASAREIMNDDLGRLKIKLGYHGRRISLSGIVRSIPSADHPQLLVENDGFLVPVETNGNAPEGLAIGCEIAATGTCIIDIDTWKQGTIFPRVKGFLLAVDGPDGIRILSHPPWWTPARFALVVTVLVLVIFGILLWNASLRIMAERRGRALFRAQEKRIESELRVDERTRLAEELHDYLAQNLTAISYQVSAAQSAYAERNESTEGILRTVDRMLKSCRTELRRCLWDLRSDALNENDFALAIRKAIVPVSGKAVLRIRFNVPRTRLSDTAAHAVISMVRELTANAVLHGKATAIRIAGEIDAGSLRFSVRDDGIGFDPRRRPGQADGHFGLDGVAERVKRLGGTLEIDSKAGGGSRIAIALPLHPVHPNATTT